ncbi:MAG: sensor domain-containing diguanylate cyclase [Desulfovibrionaceae bacterium]|nr:sensor domain-containing diguanylate cyclase [Desulfovibrionaceae bacterium]
MSKLVDQRRFFGSPRVFVATFCLVALASLALICGIENYRKDLERKRMEYLAFSKSHTISETIISLLYKAEALAALVVQGDGKIEEFERVAAILITDPAIRNILLAPGGVVSHVYPLKNNEEAVGFNLLGEGQGNREAISAKQTGRLTLGGPFETVQGGQALVGRLPVYVHRGGEQAFWGLVSVTLRYPEALKSVYLEDLYNQGYSCKIWRVNPDTGLRQIILQSDDEPLHKPVEKTFDILNAHWMISIAPRDVWYTRYIALFYLAGLLCCSLTAAVLARNYCETKRMKAMMEHMAMFDSLTGLPNRRYFFERLREEIDQCTARGGSFVLGYLDLDDFKYINDTYGHGSGDQALIRTAACLRRCLGDAHLAARIGGDEFVVMVKGESPEASQALLDELEKALREPLIDDNGRRFACSASLGRAVFPTDGTTEEELTAHADASMYRKKQRCRAHPR